MQLKRFAPLLLVLVIAVLVGCKDRNQVESREIPAISMERLERQRHKARLRLPFSTHDEQHPIVGYTEDGEPDPQIYDEVVFPTDVWVVYKESQIRVFFARSPHGGCLIFWDDERGYFHDPCYGSKFTETGEYLEGPATRDLDELPARIQNGIVWVVNEIKYGESIVLPTYED